MCLCNILGESRLVAFLDIPWEKVGSIGNVVKIPWNVQEGDPAAIQRALNHSINEDIRLFANM